MCFKIKNNKISGQLGIQILAYLLSEHKWGLSGVLDYCNNMEEWWECGDVAQTSIMVHIQNMTNLIFTKPEMQVAETARVSFFFLSFLLHFLSEK
jgi:hypothetical protein